MRQSTLTQLCRYLSEKFVARRVTTGVIHELELIKVQKYHGRTLLRQYFPRGTDFSPFGSTFSVLKKELTAQLRTARALCRDL